METCEFSLLQGQEIFIRLSKAMLQYRKAYNNAHNFLGLSPNEIGFLMILHFTPQLNSAKQIIQKLGATKSLASRSGANLSKLGLIETLHDDRDKRVTRFALTEEGRKVCRLLVEESKDFYKISMDGIPEQEIEALISTLEKMACNITGSFENKAVKL